MSEDQRGEVIDLNTFRRYGERRAPGDVWLSNELPSTPDPIAAIHHAQVAERREAMRIVGTEREEQLTRLIALAARTGSLFVAPDVWPAFQSLVGVLRAAGIEIVRHPLLEPGTMAAREPRPSR